MRRSVDQNKLHMMRRLLIELLRLVEDVLELPEGRRLTASATQRQDVA